jgi:hypothetical protein
MFAELRSLIDSQDEAGLRAFLQYSPSLDLNNITSNGFTALWWALHPPQGINISPKICQILLDSGGVSILSMSMLTVYGHIYYDFAPLEIRELLQNYRDEFTPNLTDTSTQS